MAASAAGPLASANASAEYTRAIGLERAGRLNRALALEDALRLTPRQAAHRAALADAVQTLAAARVYQEQNETAVADAVLTKVAARLDPVRDVYVNAAVQGQLAAVKALEAPKHGNGPSFFGRLWRDLKNAAETILRWLIVIAGFAVLIVLGGLIAKLVRSARAPRTGIGVALEDLSVEAAKRGEGNRALGRELAVALGAASRSAMDTPRAEIDVTKDLDGSVSLNVRVSGDELSAIEPYLDDGSPVKVGPISVSPRQLLTFVVAMFRPPYEYELRGYLASSGQTSQLAVELRQRGGAPTRWSSLANGDGSRASVILETARRVLYEASTKPIAANWPSVAAYREARAKLAAADQAQDRMAALEEARRLLERSLDMDPGNALARFDLGAVLRKLGRNAEALAQYEQVDKLAETAGWSPPPSLRRALAYSRSVALCKLDRWDQHHQALQLLEQLRKDTENDASLGAARREQVLLLVRSAWATTMVFEAERLRGEQTAERARLRSAQVLEDIREVRDWIAEARDRQPDVDLTTYVQAKAVTENAFGRVSYLNRRPREEAIEAFEQALSLVPELGDAHVNIASALLRSRSRYEDWFERVERHVTRALEISPSDRKALYLRGQLYLAAGRTDDARKAFQAAADAGDALALLRIGELAWAAGKKEEAIDLARRSLAGKPGYDHRAKLMVLWTAELADKAVVERATLLVARKAGSDLQKNAKKRNRNLPGSVLKALGVIDAKLATKPQPALTNGADAGQR